MSFKLGFLDDHMRRVTAQKGKPPPMTTEQQIRILVSRAKFRGWIKVEPPKVIDKETKNELLQ